MAGLIDRTGERFGSLVALEPTYRELSSGRKMPAWRLHCDCGNEVVAMTVNLTKGKHQSCGCKTGELIASHYPGDTKKPEYRVYRQMLDRCYLEAAPNYKWYGGKGVTVCDRWRYGTNEQTGFQCFMADMGPRPEGLTLERDDPRKPYGPDNCRWATWQEQAKNKREHYLSAKEREELARKRSVQTARKLSEQDVREIRRSVARGETQWDIARRYGIHQSTVSDIKIGAIWQHVPDAAQLSLF